MDLHPLERAVNRLRKAVVWMTCVIFGGLLVMGGLAVWKDRDTDRKNEQQDRDIADLKTKALPADLMPRVKALEERADANAKRWDAQFWMNESIIKRLESMKR